MIKAAFLDRDGVINKKAPNDGYIAHPRDFQLLPGVADAIALLNRAGFLTVVVTNQRGIAKGLVSPGDLTQIHAKMSAELATAGARLDAIYFCPHEIDPPCTCRKPAPGMLLTAAAEHHIDLPNSWMIGDSESDREAGVRAGCRTITIAPKSAPPTGDADLFAESLFEAVRKILLLPEISKSF